MLKNKELLHPVIVVIIFILLLLSIKTITPEEGIEKKFDLKYYLEMADSSPGIAEEVIPPFKYRVLLPWLAGLFNNPAAGFYLLMVIGFIVQATAFILFFREKYGTESSSLAYLFMLMSTQISVFLIQNPFNVVDLYVSAFTILFLLLLRSGRFYAALIVLLVSVFIKENFVIMVMGGLFLLAKNKAKKGLKIIIAGSFLCVMAAVLTRLLIDGAGSRYLMEQVSVHIPEKLNDPVIILKTLIGPALFILPVYLVFADKWIIHVRENKELLVIFLLTFLSTFWGANDARLMTGAGIFYYGFAAMVLKRNVSTDIIKKGKWITETENIHLFLLVLLNLLFVLLFYRNSHWYINPEGDLFSVIIAFSVVLLIIVNLRWGIIERYLCK